MFRGRELKHPHKQTDRELHDMLGRVSDGEIAGKIAIQIIAEAMRRVLHDKV